MYAELLCKTNFSFLRGASDSREYIARAFELGIEAIGITDVNGVYALPRAYEVLKKYPEVKLICGAEVTITDHAPISFLAQTREAYGLLCRILTLAHAGKEKGMASISMAEMIALLESHKGRLHLLAFPKLKTKFESEIKSKNKSFEPDNLFLLKELFGKNLYLPICQYLDGLDGARIEKVLALSHKFEIPFVASNDVHYHVPERQRLQDSLTCVREGVTLQTAGFKLFGNNERYLKSPLQMRALFKDIPEAIQNTLKISESCTFSLSELKYTYPREFIPIGHTSQSFLEEVVLIGANKTYKGLIPFNVDTQIRHELLLIKKLNYADYFLTLFDIVEFSKSKNIICQGRGSAANSVICYVLGITAIDPVHSNLLFERFISEERAEPPDIDVDFEHERREEIIQYIYSRYGRDRAAMVSAVRTYQRKSAFLEMSKAVGIDVGTISADALAQKCDQLSDDEKFKVPVVEELANELIDFPRHISIHSGGFVLSHDPITEMVPVEPARMTDRTIIQWDKNDLETLGLMKVDILALGFLTALHKCSKLIKRDWRDIPDDDLETYKMIQRAETEGTFQIESRAQKSMLSRTHPETFYDLVVQVAIVRPGPNVGDMVQPYTKRREAAKRGVAYKLPDPSIEKILGRTYGVPIFQEQIMKLAIEKADFNPGEADQLRRALAAWRSAEAVATMGKKLYVGLIKNGIPKSYADELFGYIKGYAHYGFPESHAASFALIAYKSAYLKCHHPAEFLCALINSQPMGFYPIDTLINEAKRKGVRVLPIDPNISNWDALIEFGSVRMGFRNIRGIKSDDVTQMIEARSAFAFSSVEDFVARTYFSRLVLERMAMADVFKPFNIDQRHSFWKSIEFFSLTERNVSIQQSLFDQEPADQKQDVIFKSMSLVEEISSEYKNIGYSLKGNVMKGIREQDLDLPPLRSNEAKKLMRNKIIEYAGVLTVIQRPPTAKGVAFITMEDEMGSLDFIFKKDIYETYKHIIRNSRFLKIKGKVQRQGSGVSILATSVTAFGDQVSSRPTNPGASPRSVKVIEW
jgi:error-prone DNA polymerase